MPSLIFFKKPCPLLPQVVEKLTEGWSGELLDLSEMVLILPTQESRRRLHEALVRVAATRKSALLPPVWMLPMNLPERERKKFAPSSMEQLVWIQLISGMSNEEKCGIFPRRIPPLDTICAVELADAIRILRGELSQSGITLSDAAAGRPGDARWKTLLSLEKRYLGILAEAGFSDRIASQLDGAVNPILPHGANRLLIAGVPDLPKLYDSMLPKLEERGVQIEILIHDPLDKGEQYFDALGRPNEQWAGEPIDVPPTNIHLCFDRAEEAEKAAALAVASGGTGSRCTVALTSADLATTVKDELEIRKIPAFNPAGQTLDSMPMGRLLRDIANLLAQGDFRSALQVIRHPDAVRWLELQPAHDFGKLDQIQRTLIPASLDDLIARWPEKEPTKLLHSLRKLGSLITELRESRGAEVLLKMLRDIYGSFDVAAIPGGRESADRILEWFEGGKSQMNEISSSELLVLLAVDLGSGICTSEKRPDSVELPGWLELLWEDAPHLIVTGMNDGLVPEMRQGDPFLNEKLRNQWNLPSDNSRLKRDSYLMLSIMAARPEPTGRIDLLLARHDSGGSALKPSRLLLRCANDRDFPIRVKEFFRDLRPRSGERWRSAWALKPARKKPPIDLSASAIRDYMTCPTRFYLKHLLHLKGVQFGLDEADSATFGTLLHDTLRDFGNNLEFKDLCDEQQIATALTSIWKQHFSTRFGDNPLFQLIYQREAGIRRLRGVARAQASTRAEGWEIAACEIRFKDFHVNGMTIKGQIDRIDRRITEKGVEWRIIDYKSSEKVKHPDKEHYRPINRQDDIALLGSYEHFLVKGKRHRWIDLQLIIYRMALLSAMESGKPELHGLQGIQPGPVESAYVILPSEIDKTVFIPFTNDPEISRSAEDCLKGVLGAIRRGIFWPPRHPKYDDLSDLFFDHIEETDASSAQQTLDSTNLLAVATP